MISMGLNTIERRIYEKTLVKSHKVNIKVLLQDLNLYTLLDVSDKMLDGQVTISASATNNVRSLSITMLDPNSEMDLDTGDGSDGTLFIDRALRIYYEVYVPDLPRGNKWVSVPVFTGPISSAERQGLILQIEAVSKELLAQTVWSPYTIKAKTNKVSAIKIIMERAGEAYYGDLGKTTGRLGKNLTLARDTIAWAAAKDIAQSLNRYLYYDAMGRLYMRVNSSVAVYAFRTGDYGSILSDVDISVDPDGLHNTVSVTGATPTKGKAPTYTATATRSHPLSPWSLGRTVKGSVRPRYIPMIVQSDHYKTVSACKARATSLLASQLDNSVQVKFDALPIPHIEPNDTCLILTDKMNMSFKFTTVTLPLSGEGKMTVGYTKNQLINKYAIRNKK